MEVGVAGADAADTVFAHENCGMGVMKKVTRKVGELLEHLVGHVGVP